MGRGKHLTHKERTIQMGVKLPISVYRRMTSLNLNLPTDAYYLRTLILKDLEDHESKTEKDN